MSHLAVALAALLVAQATPPPTPPPLAAPSATPSPTPAASALPGQPSPAASPTPSGPRLTLSATQLNLNPAQQSVVLVSGASPPLTATTERKLVTVTADPNAANVTIAATQATGTDVVHLVDANGATAEIAVRVAFNAGTIVPQTTLRVTGDPATPDWLARQVAGLVARLTQAMPGAQASIGTAPVAPSPLPPGAQTQFSIPISITSPDGQYFDVSGTTNVTVENVAADPFAPALLFYDDDPEHVHADGVLFRGTVAAGQPARLYYYHDDVADPRRILVMLTTDAPQPASVQVIDATAGPNMDVLTVGNAVTREFLLRKAYREGVIVDVAQDVPLALHDVPVTARQLVAGSVDFRVLSGGPVLVTVLAVSPGVDPRTLLAGPVLPGDGHHRTGVFSIAGFGDESLAYDAGGADAKVVIGDREPTAPNVDPNADGHDYGDYGVLQSIVATLTNPLETPANAYLYFRPIAGVARATFLVDGALVQLGCVREPVPYQIAAFSLAPHQTYRANVQTMTDGGSFYPVEIGVTATAPQPSAPPITAPDGCFPKPVPAASPSPETSASPEASPPASPEASPSASPAPSP